MVVDQKHITTVTLLLAAVAGFCDTVTFVAGDTIFSAHVTGNFIVFAYQMVTGADITTWIKLLTFPVFITAVIAGGRLSANSENQNRLLLAEAVLLTSAGLLAFTLGIKPSDKIVMYGIVMLVVFALGLQNAFGKLFSKATHGPTTMMTGNVTQASLDLGLILSKGFKATDAMASLKKQSVTISGFLIGCLLGAVTARQFGLSAIMFAGFSMLLCYFLSNRNTAQKTVAE